MGSVLYPITRAAALRRAELKAAVDYFEKMSTSVSFAKIVGTATETRWAQIYHAGDLFAVVSLAAVEDHPELNSMGRELFNTLEADFFSLEEKKLTTIKAVIAENVRTLPPELTVSACIAYSRDGILYLFLIGSGSILMRRGEKLGVLLTQTHGPREQILASSGYLEHGDILLLETGAFATLLTEQTVKEAMELHLPNAITEKLTAKLEALPGDAAALSLMYQGAAAPEAPTLATAMRKELRDAEPSAKDPEPEEEKNAAENPETKADTEADEPVIHPQAAPEPTEDESQPVFRTEGGKGAPSRLSFLPALPLPPLSRRGIFGLAAAVIALILIGSVIFTKQQTQSVQTKSTYEQTLKQAQEKYDEAEGLKNLNAALAQEDYKKARDIITAGLPHVTKGSTEEQNLRTLLRKIETNIEHTEGQIVEPKAVDLSESPLLSLAAKKDTAYVTADEGKRYALTPDAIVDEKDKAVIKNEDDWKKPGGIAGYNGNLYLLDKADGVLKFTAGSGGYGKSSYFSGDAPSLTTAASMAIDGSVWILFSDGSVKKYTKGKAEGFSVSGLPSPFKNPTQLFTDSDTESLYILDKGNSRIVVLDKNGTFKKAYQASILAKATAIDVQEKEKKIYILQAKTLFMLPLE